MLTVSLAAALVAGLLLYWFTGSTGLLLAASALGSYAVGRRQTWSLDRLPVRPALLYGGWLVVATALSLDFFRSLPAALWQAALGLAALVVATHVRTDAEARSLLRALALASVVVMAPNVYEWVQAGAPLLWRVTYDHNNGVALFNLIFIVALATGELKRWQWWPWLVAFAWLTWFSASRGAAFGLTASLWVALLLGQNLTVFAWASTMAALLVTGVGVALFDSGRLTSLSDRDQYWRVGWGMATASPVLGTGSDTFVKFYDAVYPERAVYNFNHAHNLYLNTAAEAGLPALVLGAWLTVEVLVRLWARRSSAWAAGALAALAGLLAHSLVDVPTSSAYVAAALVGLVAVGLTVE